jgi:hypothetical protein
MPSRLGGKNVGYKHYLGLCAAASAIVSPWGLSQHLRTEIASFGVQDLIKM